MNSPPARSDSAAAYVPTTNTVVIYGGFSGTSYLGDLWTLDPGLGVWTQQHVTGPAPGPRADGRMVYDSVAHELVLFGGNDYSGPGLTFHHLADTWVLDPTSYRWSELSPLFSPPARDYAFEGFDSRENLVLLFGGFGDNVVLSDTWALDLNTSCWTKLLTGPAPPARYAGGAGYDPTDRLFLVTTGVGEPGLFNDTWALEPIAPPATTAFVPWTSLGLPLFLVAVASLPVPLLVAARRRASRRASGS